VGPLRAAGGISPNEPDCSSSQPKIANAALNLFVWGGSSNSMDSLTDQKIAGELSVLVLVNMAYAPSGAATLGL
jgi:hypothetical protein